MAFRAKSQYDPPVAPPPAPEYPLVDTVPDVIFSEGGGVQTYDLNQHVTLEGLQYEAAFQDAPGSSPPAGVSLSGDGILTYDGTSPAAESPYQFQVEQALATGTTLATFDLVSATGGVQPFTIGHPIQKGQATEVRADLVDCQVQVRNRWDDGSVKFAVVSGSANLTAGVPTTVTLSTGSRVGTNITEADLIALNPLVTLSFSTVRDVFGVQTAPAHSVSLAACLGNVAVFGADPLQHTSGLIRSFLGPDMSEFHYYRTTQDKHLRVFWYVRLYSSGDMEVETVVECGSWFNVTAPGTRVYTLSLSVNGTVRATENFIWADSPQTILRLSDTQIDTQYARYGTDQRVMVTGDTVNYGLITNWESGNIATIQWDSGVCPQNPTSIALQGHVHHTKWQNVQWYGTAPDVEVTIDGDYWKMSKLVPNFVDHKQQASQWYNAVDTTSFALTREDAQELPYGEIRSLVRVYSTGAFSDHGVQVPHLSFELLYFRDGFQDSLWANEFYTRAEQFYSIYYRDELTGLPVNPQDHEDYAINGNYSGGTSYGVGGQVITTPEPFGRPYYYWDDQHSLPLGYLHYIITSRWTSLEKITQQFSFGNYMQTSVDRNYTECILYDRSDRGFWTQMRDTNMVCSMLPESINGANATHTANYTALRNSVISVLENRIQWVYDDYVSQPEYALGYLYEDPQRQRINIYGQPPGDIHWLKMWMQAMQFNGFGRGYELEVPISSAKWTTYLACLNHSWNWIAGALGTYATTGHPWRFAFGAYVYAGADYDEVADERGPLYTTWSDVFTNTWNNPDGGPLSDWYSTFVNGEGVLEDTPGLWYMNSGGNNTPFTYRDSRVWHTVMYLGNVIYSLAQAVDAGHTGCLASWNLITQIGNNWWFDLNEELSYSYPQKVYIPRSL